MMNALVRLAANRPAGREQRAARRKRVAPMFALRLGGVAVVFAAGRERRGGHPGGAKLRGRLWHPGLSFPDRHTGPVAQVHGVWNFRRRRQWHRFHPDGDDRRRGHEHVARRIGWHALWRDRPQFFRRQWLQHADLDYQPSCDGRRGYFKSTPTCWPHWPTSSLVGGQITGHDNVGGLIGSPVRSRPSRTAVPRQRSRAIRPSADWSGRTAAPSRAAARAAR